MHIIVTGNPVDGFEFYGPCDDANKAVEFGDTLAGDWWVAEIEQVTGHRAIEKNRHFGKRYGRTK